MEFTSVVKRIDNLGRIVLPKDVRKKLKLNETDEVEIIVKEDNTVILKKYCVIEEYEQECIALVKLLKNIIRDEIIITDNCTVCVCSNNEYVGKELSPEYIEFLSERKVGEEKNLPTSSILDKILGLYTKILVPIIVDSAVIGAIAVFSKDRRDTLDDTEKEVIKFVSSILSYKINT